MAKSNVRPSTEINASSMADIAFLLLIFFLVTTTINVDKGILHKLPPKDPNQEEIELKFKPRNVMNILVNSLDQLLVGGELMDISRLRQETKEFVNNYGKNPDLSVSPQKAIVSLKNDRGTSYDIYLQVQNELKGAYRELRDAYGEREFGKTLTELDKLSKDRKLPKEMKQKYKQQAKTIRKEYPMRISEAEPESIGASL